MSQATSSYTASIKSSSSGSMPLATQSVVSTGTVSLSIFADSESHTNTSALTVSLNNVSESETRTEVVSESFTQTITPPPTNTLSATQTDTTEATMSLTEMLNITATPSGTVSSTAEETVTGASGTASGSLTVDQLTSTETATRSLTLDSTSTRTFSLPYFDNSSASFEKSVVSVHVLTLGGSKAVWNELLQSNYSIVESSVKSDISSATLVPARFITITRMEGGSLIVEFQVVVTAAHAIPPDVVNQALMQGAFSTATELYVNDGSGGSGPTFAIRPLSATTVRKPDPSSGTLCDGVCVIVIVTVGGAFIVCAWLMCIFACLRLSRVDTINALPQAHTAATHPCDEDDGHSSYDVVVVHGGRLPPTAADWPREFHFDSDGDYAGDNRKQRGRTNSPFASKDDVFSDPRQRRRHHKELSAADVLVGESAAATQWPSPDKLTRKALSSLLRQINDRESKTPSPQVWSCGVAPNEPFPASDTFAVIEEVAPETVRAHPAAVDLDALAPPRDGGHTRQS